MRIGALEAGGTKMVLGIFSEDGKLLERETISTEDPETTVPLMREYFRRHEVDALGVAGFGPLDLAENSPTYGFITCTPKLAWRNYPLLSEVRGELDIPCGIDTDVNAAVLAEIKMGAAKGLENAVYITVGTGIGGGICVDGQLVHGMIHPEVGHMLLRPHPQDPNPRGVCPYHESCLEGLASGPAISARASGDVRDLSDEHPAFDVEAYYLAAMCANLILTVSPERIILGGGVMQRKSLFGKVRRETVRLLNNYVQHAAILKKMDEYIVEPKLFPISGLVGAYLLGLRAYKRDLDK